MNEKRLFRAAGWAAILSAVVNLVSLISVVSFVVSSDFGPLADLPSLIWVALTIPVALTLHVILRSDAPGLSLAAAAVGILALAVIGVFQALLVTGVLAFGQQSAIVQTATGVVGIWLLLVNSLALRGNVFPRGLGWTGLLACVGFMLLGVGAWVGGPQSPATIAGFLGSVLTYPIWQFWLGRWLLRRGRSAVVSVSSNVPPAV